jgi:hypothetical protein
MFRQNTTKKLGFQIRSIHSYYVYKFEQFVIEKHADYVRTLARKYGYINLLSSFLINQQEGRCINLSRLHSMKNHH